ncbi:MAG: hypothetical protein KA319_03810 [Ferruginibacter sp.]|nr:hypothetical protein [Ferruginibacter sp.]
MITFSFRKLILSFVTLFCFTKASFTQTPEAILNKINFVNYPEKIYLQYDKQSYIAGETIWFKAFLIQNLLPAKQSTVLAVELINEQNETINKKILPIFGASAIGDFTLPTNLTEGVYRVKAYTRKYMSFSNVKPYEQSIVIYSPNSKKVNAIQNSNDSITINFFPEGGNFVVNKNTAIAFRCVNKKGYPVNVEGNIVNQTGKVILNFKSTHYGMGKFVLNSNSNEKYFAQCKFANNTSATVALPNTIEQGVNLSVLQSSDIGFYLDISNINIEDLQPSYILGVQETKVLFNIPININQKEVGGKIPTKDLPTGILQLTVFNKNHKPLAERLLFINSQDYIVNTFFTAEKVNLQKRGKNNFSFRINEKIKGTYALAVTDGNNTSDNYDNILSKFLLTTDVKGLVYNPSYYFEKIDNEHIQNLDLVMLTNGWRKYNWTELYELYEKKYFLPDPNYVNVKGIAYDSYTKQPITSQTLTMYVKTKDNYSDLMYVDVDSSGVFYLPQMVFEDTVKIAFYNRNGSEDKMKIKLNTQSIGSMFHLPNLSSAYFKSNLQDSLSPWVKEILERSKNNSFEKGIVLKEIKVQAKVKTEKEKYEKSYVGGRLGGSAAREIDFFTNPTSSSQNILEFLKPRLFDVNITGGPAEYSVTYRGIRSISNPNAQMALFLDEMNVDTYSLLSIQASEVALVRVYSHSAGVSGNGSALAIYTKKGGGTTTKTGLTDVFVEGFSPTKEFFSPNYEDANNNINIDERSTLYWNPYLNTDENNNEIKFSFYNSDKAKQFKIIIEGILENGKLLHFEKIITE